MKITNLCSANVATITHNSKSIQDLELVQTILIPKLNLNNSLVPSEARNKEITKPLSTERKEVGTKLKKLSIKGPLGECSVILPQDLDLKIEKENLNSLKISFRNQDENKAINTSWIKNMIIGVTEGFKKQIKLIGVGYKINLSTKQNVSYLNLNIGFSHPVSIEIPKNIYVNEDSKKANNSDPSSIELFSTSLTDLNNFVYSIAKIKPVEKSFKGTGITIINP